jgi:hypothetical protein
MDFEPKAFSFFCSKKGKLFWNSPKNVSARSMTLLLHAPARAAIARLNTVSVPYHRFQILRSLHRDADAPPSALPKPDPVSPILSCMYVICVWMARNSPLQNLR